jgi:hypothetical protein
VKKTKESKCPNSRTTHIYPKNNYEKSNKCRMAGSNKSLVKQSKDGLKTIIPNLELKVLEQFL